MENKILIRTDWGRESRILEEAETSIGAINTVLKPALEKIGFELTSEVLNDCLNGASKLKTEYHKKMKKDLGTMLTPSIKERMRVEAEGALELFENKLIKVLREIKGSKPYITVLDGLATFTPEARERLTESCKVYLSDPKQIKAYNNLVAACDSLNALFNGNLPFQWIQVFSIKGGKITPNENLDYSRLTNGGGSDE